MIIETLIKELPPAPDDVLDWIRSDCVQKTYIFYSRKNRKAVCSRCGYEYILDEDGYCHELEDEYLKHNKKLVCTNCWHDAIAKAEGIGCKNLNEYFRVLLFVRRGHSLYASLTEVVVDFTSQIPGISTWVSALYKFNKNEQAYYKNHPWYENTWENRSHNIKLPTPATNMGWTKFDVTNLYTRNFDTVFNVPVLKYADVADVYRGNDLNAYGVLGYIPLAIRHQSLELLRKAGYKKIFDEKITDTGFSRACNWRATNIEKILRVKTKGQAKEIKAANLSLGELLVYQQYCKGSWNCPARLIPTLNDLNMHDYNGNKAAIIGSHIDAISAAEYIFRQQEKYKEENRNVTLSDYSDYLQECEKLGYNLTDKHTLKPKDLLLAHEKSAAALLKIKDKVDAVEFTKNMIKITGMKEPYIQRDLMIRPAMSAAELRAEGKSLGHCVGGYAGKIIDGTSAILFIRQAKEPGTAFYTLELDRKGKITQCRGKGNRSMTEEVKAFVDQWIDEVVNRYYKDQRKQKAA